jgi:hypothetical protein
MDIVLPVHLLSLGLPRWSAIVPYLVMCVLIALAARVVSRLSGVVEQLRLLARRSSLPPRTWLSSA